MDVFSCVYFVGPHGYLTPTETRRGCWILWDCNYRQFLTVIWVLGWNPGPQEDQPVS